MFSKKHEKARLRFYSSILPMASQTQKEQFREATHLMKSGQFGEAITIFSDHWRDQPIPRIVSVNKASCYGLLDNLDEAIKTLRQINGWESDNCILNKLVDYYWRKRSFNDVIAIYSEPQFQAYDSDALKKRIQRIIFCHRQSGQYEEAIAFIKTSFPNWDASCGSWLAIARLYEEAGDHTKALVTYQNVKKAFPMDLGVNYHYCRYLLKQQHKEACISLAEALKQWPIEVEFQELKHSKEFLALKKQRFDELFPTFRSPPNLTRGTLSLFSRYAVSIAELEYLDNLELDLSTDLNVRLGF